MNIYKNRFLILLLSSSLLLSGCDKISAKEYTKEENISADFSATGSESIAEETIAATSETLTNAENGQIHKTIDENGNSLNEYLPKEISMDDLRNMVQINGKTLTMPTTLSDIMKIDDRFSYSMTYADYFSTPEESLKEQGSVMYDIICNGSNFIDVGILKDDYKDDFENSIISVYPPGFYFNKFEEADLELTFLNEKISENSTPDDIIELFGEPNNQNSIAPHDMNYLFYNKEYNIIISFIFNKSEELSECNLICIRIECYQIN